MPITTIRIGRLKKLISKFRKMKKRWKLMKKIPPLIRYLKERNEIDCRRFCWILGDLSEKNAHFYFLIVLPIWIAQANWIGGTALFTVERQFLLTSSFNLKRGSTRKKLVSIELLKFVQLNRFIWHKRLIFILIEFNLSFVSLRHFFWIRQKSKFVMSKFDPKILSKKKNQF